MGYEALIRWDSANLGMVSPAEFTPTAARTRIIVPIGYRVIEQAARQLNQWMGEGLDNVYISVGAGRRYGPRLFILQTCPARGYGFAILTTVIYFNVNGRAVHQNKVES